MKKVEGITKEVEWKGVRRGKTHGGKSLLENAHCKCQGRRRRSGDTMSVMPIITRKWCRSLPRAVGAMVSTAAELTKWK